MKASPKAWAARRGRRRSQRISAARNLRIEALEARQLLHGGTDWLAPLAAEGEGVPVADFALVDANTTSLTSGQEVSPRDFQGKVSAWYFGDAL